MKYIKFLAIAVAALGFAACSSSEKAETTAETTEAQTATTTAIAPIATDGKVIELTDAATLMPGTEVKQLTVVDFNAVWCGPCRQLAPVLADMAMKYQGKVTFFSVDIDRLGQLMDAYNLGNAIPVVLFIKPDGTTTHYVGTSDLLPAEKFESLIEEQLK